MLTGELSAIADALSRLAGKPAWSRGDVQLVADCEALQALEHRLAGVKLSLLGELDDRGLAREQGATSTLAWVRWRWRVSAGSAGAMVRLARQLRQHPTTARQLIAGQLNVEQARAIVESLGALPADLDELMGDWLHEGPLEGTSGDGGTPGRDGGPVGPLPATGSEAAVGSEAAAGSEAAVGSDVAASGMEGDLATANRRFTPWHGGVEGIVGQVEGILLAHADALDATGLRAAGRYALAKVAPDVADEVERRALERDERRAYESRRLDLHDDAVGGTVVRGYLDREGAAVLRTALSPLTAPRGVDEQRSPGQRSAGQRRADALVEVCRKVMAGGGLPSQGAQPTQLVVTASYDVLTKTLGVGQLDTGERLSAATVRRLACDAAILPAVLGGEGQVLDLGRSRRLFTGAIRRALNLRDGGCTFPGCDRPVDWTQGHHIVSWLDGGRTDVANGALLCEVHHHAVHEPGGWRVRLGVDGLPEFVPPAWLDPERKPLRHARFRTRAP